jgi:hypothetical protein
VWDVKYQYKVLIRTSKFASVLLESVGHGLKTCIRKGQNETTFERQGLQLGRETRVKGFKRVFGICRKYGWNRGEFSLRPERQIKSFEAEFIFLEEKL